MGEFIPVHKVTAARLRAAIDKVSGDPGYRAKAQDYQRRIAQLHVEPRAGGENRLAAAKAAP